MKKLLLLLTLFLMACAVEQAPVVEAPTELPTAPPQTPAAAPVEPTPTTTGTTTSDVQADTASPTCEDDCVTLCAADAPDLCKDVPNYSECATRCGTNIRDQGCKAACAADAPKECELIYESECKRECRTRCA